MGCRFLRSINKSRNGRSGAEPTWRARPATHGANVRVQARIAEIMRAGAERAEVTVEQVVRELKLIGFSDIRKVVSWRCPQTRVHNPGVPNRTAAAAFMMQSTMTPAASTS